MAHYSNVNRPQRRRVIVETKRGWKLLHEDRTSTRYSELRHVLDRVRRDDEDRRAMSAFSLAREAGAPITYGEISARVAGAER